MWRTFRRFPFLFLLCAFVGLAVGIGLLFIPGTVIKIIGAGCVVFYGGLALMYFIKKRDDSWNHFCDWGYSIFENMV